MNFPDKVNSMSEVADYNRHESSQRGLGVA